MVKLKHWIYIVLFLTLIGGLNHAYNKYEDKVADLQTELIISQQNYLAETDSLRSDIKTKEGDIVYMKHMYLTKEDELNKKLGELERNNEDLKLKLNHYISLAGQVKHDTIIIKPDTIIKSDSIDRIHFNYIDKWTTLDGVTCYNKYNNNKTYTKINNLLIEVPLCIGLTDDHQVVITSKNPNLNITEVTGISSLVPKKKRKIEFSHGIQFGLGVHYGLIHNRFDIGPSFTYGLEFKF